jgi:hypothetical protein
MNDSTSKLHQYAFHWKDKLAQNNLSQINRMHKSFINWEPVPKNHQHHNRAAKEPENERDAASPLLKILQARRVVAVLNPCTTACIDKRSIGPDGWHQRTTSDPICDNKEIWSCCAYLLQPPEENTMRHRRS